MILIKSLIFQIYFYCSVLIASLLVVILPNTYSSKFKIARSWGSGMIWAGSKICGLKFKLEGVENIPKTPSVIMIRHSSVFEAYAQLVVFPQQTWIVKKELNWIPIFGLALKNLKAISIDRKSGRSAVTQVIRQGKERLKQGIWITIFPEGTRMMPGETKRYGISGAALAKEAGVCIVPVAHNAEDFWKSGTLQKKPGTIRFCIGKPIETCDLAPKDVIDDVKFWIDEKMKDISEHHHS